jgi:hypothetical protein
MVTKPKLSKMPSWPLIEEDYCGTSYAAKLLGFVGNTVSLVEKVKLKLKTCGTAALLTH